MCFNYKKVKYMFADQTAFFKIAGMIHEILQHLKCKTRNKKKWYKTLNVASFFLIEPI